MQTLRVRFLLLSETDETASSISVSEEDIFKKNSLPMSLSFMEFAFLVKNDAPSSFSSRCILCDTADVGTPNFIMLGISALLVISAFTAENTVYVTDGGTGDGSTATTPVGTLADAYAALGTNDGKIVITNTLTVSSKFIEPTHSGKITVTGGTLAVSNIRYILNGATTFENITLKGNRDYLTIVAQFNPIVFGEGITVSGFGSFTGVGNSVTIVGGLQSGEDKCNDDSLLDKDPSITVKSGKVLIICSSRHIDKNYTGTVNLNIEGGTFSNIYFGVSDGGYAGDANVNISGGTFLRNIFSNAKISKLSGSVNVRVTGGDFSASTFERFDGSVVGEGATSVADVRGLKDYSTLVGKMEGFTKIITDEGEIFPDEKLAIKEAFLYGSFTASDGTVIPYRYYLPEDYETSGKDYPVFLYMHGNGSRGTNNTSQLSTYSINHAIYESAYDCIMIAPQCPSAPYEWTIKGTTGINTYPGSEAYAAFLESGEPYPSKYFCAAAELLGMFLTDYRADTSKVYLGGSSNGTGAVWNLMTLYPEVFAGAVTVAGSRAENDYVHAVAHRMNDIPIWAFHGDSDTTVLVKGTRIMVNAVKEAGGNITYTEVAGGTHGNIWKIAANTPGVVDWLFSQTNDSFENTISKAKGAALPTPQNLDWEKGSATWDSVQNAGAYKVMFYVDGILEKTVFTCNTYYTLDLDSFSSGDCTFTVTAFPENNAYSISAESAASKAYSVEIDIDEVADFNGDGTINVSDVLILLKSAVNNNTAWGCVINGDGRINIADVLRLIKHIIK